jgi:hypothetical protein
MFSISLRSLSAAAIGLLQFQGVVSAALPSPHAGLAASVPYQFPNGTWLENLAIRANGDVLTTVLSPDADLYRLPASDGHKSAELVHRFSGVNGLLGITEVCADEFAIIAGQFNADSSAVPKSFELWTAKFDRNNGVSVSKVVDMPHLGFANGMTTLDAKTGIVLIADSARGLIWSVNIRTGEQQLALKHPSMKPVEDMPPKPIGINGVRVYNLGGTTYVYYTSMNKNLLVRVPVNPATAEAAGKYELFQLPTGPTDMGTTPDDFCVDEDGVAYIAANVQNRVISVDTTGQIKAVAGGYKKTLLEGVTGVALGRFRDQQILFASTSGGSAVPIDGYYEGGKIVQIRLDEI